MLWNIIWVLLQILFSFCRQKKFEHWLRFEIVTAGFLLIGLQCITCRKCHIDSDMSNLTCTSSVKLKIFSNSEDLSVLIYSSAVLLSFVDLCYNDMWSVLHCMCVCVCCVLYISLWSLCWVHNFETVVTLHDRLCASTVLLWLWFHCL